MASRPSSGGGSSPASPAQRRRLFRAEITAPSGSQDTDSPQSSIESRGRPPQPPSRPDPVYAGRKVMVPRNATRTSANARVPRQKVRNIKGLATKSGRTVLGDLKGSAKRKAGKVVRKDHAVREIQRYQKSTALLMQKLPFSRLVREISQQFALQSPADYSGTRWTVDAMWCIQEAAEAYLVYLLEEAYLFTLHARRVTLMPRDIRLWKRLQNPRRG